MNPLVVNATKRYAYVVTMFGGDGYVPGAITVANAFRRFGDDKGADIVCMITNDISPNAKQLLKQFFTHVVDIDYLIFDAAVNPVILKVKPHYAKVWTKFQALRLTEYNKICLIDADYLPVKSMLNVFKYDAPAAVTEVPTGIDTVNFDFSRDETYSPEWMDLFGGCCQTGKLIPGIVLLMLMYSNNVDSESGRYASMPQFTGNFYYGGMNASVMVLEPNIHEFRDIIKDLSTYDNTKRLTFFYPEQQYLTVRYAFGRSLSADQIPIIIKEFLNFIDPYFDIFYAKLSQFKNILSKESLSICKNSCSLSKDKKMSYTIDIVNILSDLLMYYINIQSDRNPSKIGPWTSLGLEYFDTEYYTNLPDKSQVIGYPILQQKKLWTTAGIDLIKQNQASNGYYEWFQEFSDTVNNIAKTMNPNDKWLHDKVNSWITIIQYYNDTISSMSQP